MKITIKVLLFLFFSCNIFSQEIIFLKNPSFESPPKYGSVPKGWQNCAFNGETPPDIHPMQGGGIFQVIQKPKNGRSYIGLVGRDNATVESVGQELDQPLKAGQCYELSIWLCKSEVFTAMQRHTGKMSNFKKPLILRAWGGLSPCGRKVLLASSPLIDHADWKKYRFRFKPTEDITWLCLEAHHGIDTDGAYNGNILIDHASPIIPIDCNSFEHLADTITAKRPLFKYVKYRIPANSDWASFGSRYQNTTAGRYFRVAENPSEVHSIIERNCPLIGFKKNSYKLLGNNEIGLMETAVNIKKFDSLYLTIGIFSEKNKLFKKRSKVITRIFTEAGLPKNQYKVLPISAISKNKKWHCGENGIWLLCEEKLIN